MKGTARLIGSISGRAYPTGSATATAARYGAPVASGAVVLGPVGGSASRTRDVGLIHWLHVTPEEPQQLVWLVPQVGIDYQIETSTNLKWQIK